MDIRLSVIAWVDGQWVDAERAAIPILSLDGRALGAPGSAVERITPLYWERVREEAHV